MNSSKEFINLLTIMLLLTFSIFLLNTHLETVTNLHVSSDTPSYTVVIDAGHGGFDSGKVGIDGTLEKDLNLMIAKKLEQLLKSADINVIMTRTEDTGLYEESSANKKRQDMTARTALMQRRTASSVFIKTVIP